MNEFPPIPDCWYLTGATASGKTRIGIQLAEAIDAEIISLDSMAVYQGMNIGTAKPSIQDRARIQHHLVDVVEPDQEFSLAEYLTRTHRAVEEIRSRGKEVLFVGGTPLYLKSLLRGLCEGPPADLEFRKTVEEEVDRVGVAALRQRLEQVDPLSAAKLHPNDRRRMIRALEVYKLTGQPISHYQMQFDEDHAVRGERVFVLSWGRSVLHQRINERVDAMFARGFVDEVRTLLDRYGGFSSTALQGVGYREVAAMLREEIPENEAIEQTKARTRRFARRQETWFRGLDEAQWISMQDASDEKVLLRLRNQKRDTESSANGN